MRHVLLAPVLGPALVVPLVAALVAALVAPVGAQEVQEVMVRSSPAWLGISYDARWVLEGGSCSPQVVIENVVQGSPAERAGLRIGDAIIAVDDEPVPPGRLQTLAARLIPGDSVRLRFLRDGHTHDVTAVADRRPDRPLTVFVEAGGRVRSMGTPVIERAGDAIIARNAAEWDPKRVRGFWVREPDGRTEYHVIGRGSSPLDERVAQLLACADSARYQPQGDRTLRVAIQRVQERADSLRTLYNVRALERAEGVRLSRPDSAAVYLFRTDSGTVSPGASYAFAFENHVTLGLRGVAGAELTALEPELAEYFRNADQGLLVLRIAPGTPAHRAGLRPGDVVIAADGRRLESVAELRQIIALPTGDAIGLRIVRRGRVRDLELRRE